MLYVALGVEDLTVQGTDAKNGFYPGLVEIVPEGTKDFFESLWDCSSDNSVGTYGDSKGAYVVCESLLPPEVDGWLRTRVRIEVDGNWFGIETYGTIHGHPMLVVTSLGRSPELDIHNMDDDWAVRIFPLFGEDLRRFMKQLERMYESREVLEEQQEAAHERALNHALRQEGLDDKSIKAAREALLLKHALDDASVEVRRSCLRRERPIVPKIIRL